MDDAAEGILEDIRLLSQTVHSSVLDDLGLDAALRQLARDAARGMGVTIDVDTKRGQRVLPPQVNSAFLRVADEGEMRVKDQGEIAGGHGDHLEASEGGGG